MLKLLEDLSENYNQASPRSILKAFVFLKTASSDYDIQPSLRPIALELRVKKYFAGLLLFLQPFLETREKKMLFSLF